jgi:oligoendopeptidase F
MRKHRELPATELNLLVVAAQQECYGDAIDPATFHPYMWAYRPHLFDASQSFMNFPYMFGLLFSLGLYARYRDEPSGFSDRFDGLLAATGESDPATLAATFGIDLRDPAFWRASLDVICADIDEFERLAEGR